MPNQKSNQKLSELVQNAWDAAKKAGKIVKDAVMSPDIAARVLSGLKKGVSERVKFVLKTGVKISQGKRQN